LSLLNGESKKNEQAKEENTMFLEGAGFIVHKPDLSGGFHHARRNIIKVS